MESSAKKTILISIWCGALVLILAAGGWWWYTLIQFKTYHNSEFKFTIKYPKQWGVMEHAKSAAVGFIRPKKTALDVFQANVNITVQEVPLKIDDLKSFSGTIIKQLKGAFSKNLIIVEDKEATFAHRKGHRLVIDAPGPSKLKMVFVWTLKGPFAYVFTFMCQDNQYKELLPTINRMITSFDFK